MEGGPHEVRLEARSLLDTIGSREDPGWDIVTTAASDTETSLVLLHPIVGYARKDSFDVFRPRIVAAGIQVTRLCILPVRGLEEVAGQHWARAGLGILVQVDAVVLLTAFATEHERYQNPVTRTRDV